MTYYVVWPDGRKFGPAKAATLAQWHKEGRIDSSTVLEEVETGRQLPFSSLDPEELHWEEPAPLPPELNRQDFEVQQALATDRPVGESNFEIPQEFPMSSGSPYPVESYYVKGRGELSTAWSLIIAGFVCTLATLCCSMAGLAGLALTGTGVYYADKAKKAGEPGAETAKIVGIVAIVLQLGALFLYVGFIAMMMTGLGRP